MKCFPLENNQPAIWVASYVTTCFFTHIGPAMRLLHEIVVPRIAADWSIVADYLEYEVEYKRIIKERCHHDPVKCCVELLEDWLSSDRGVSPKSWSRLIEALKGIKNLKATIEKIVQELVEAGVDITK